MDIINKLAYNKSFWSDYLWLTEVERTYPELENYMVIMPVHDQMIFKLELDEDFSLLSLLLATKADDEGLEIAWDDQAHPHPYVFRFEELERISDAIGRHPDYRGPVALPFLLLFRFTAVLPEEWDRFAQVVKESFQSLYIFNEEELAELLAHIVRIKGLEFQWIQEEQGWVLVGEDAYSSRNRHNHEFPFALLENSGSSLGGSD
ncbi:hypothetical protein [Paenibacillus eucommiae]|uniref:DUF4261 domain-containing protein n=1 Tax=Paenibacillus eucommiae TaxID=1355755 RepID=A0ABS4IP64_9BACL|nr:hypothetical protein [Paenibacillus eucommiae]MBP1989344.1 hypothetical protein [Paenibacillus eucommiae]